MVFFFSVFLLLGLRRLSTNYRDIHQNFLFATVRVEIEPHLPLRSFVVGKAASAVHVANIERDFGLERTE